MLPSFSILAPDYLTWISLISTPYESKFRAWTELNWMVGSLHFLGCTVDEGMRRVSDGFNDFPRVRIGGWPLHIMADTTAASLPILN